MKSLILLANEFPFGNWEPYLETEIKYYDVFDHVYICSLQLRKEHKNTCRTLSLKNVKSFAVEKAPRWVYLLYSVKALCDRNLYSEIKKLTKENRFSMKRLEKLMVYLSRSHYEANVLLKYFKEEGLLSKTKKAIGGGTFTLTGSSTSRMWGFSLQDICRATGFSPGHIDLICTRRKEMYPTFQ